MKPITQSDLSGSWATLLLTTDKDGMIDYKKLEDEIDVLIASGTDGIYSNGTAGEFYTQTESEFVRINECLAIKCEQAGIPFQIGISHMSPQISLERLHLIKQLRPGAVQIILPDWFPVTIDEAVIYMQRMEENAEGIPFILYNPPHAKKVLTPVEWMKIKERIPSLIGVKVSDKNRDSAWYKEVKKQVNNISVFIPGHHLATGISLGAQGTYSNMACLNPFAAQKWYELIKKDEGAGLELEQRILQFMDKVIHPFIVRDLYPNHACDRFMAITGAWADIGNKLRWPYRSIPEEYTAFARTEGRKIIPEFFTK
jgi:dihydrodipicolinate synthase/N-acetylneuraminate lyase